MAIEPTSFRISGDSKEQLEALARSEDRTFSDLVNVAVREFLERHGEQRGEQQRLVDGVSITITPQKVGEDPSIFIFHVYIQDTRSGTPEGWTDAWGSEELLQAYLRGIEAGAAMVGKTFISRPTIPVGGYR